MSQPDDAETFLSVRTHLHTPVIGDVLDALGCYHQFLPPGIRPLRTDMVLVGRAMPVLITDVFGRQEKPFGLLTEALDQLETGEVYLAREGRLNASAWGELLTTAARVRGAVGAVIDGYHRDTPRILEQDWPVFSRGAYAQDAGVRSAVVAYRVEIEIAGVTVSPGDLLVGDQEGVIVIPRRLEGRVIEAAMEKVQTEDKVRDALAAGMSSTEAFRRFGVL